MDKKYAAALREYAPFVQTVGQLLPQADNAHARVTVQVTAPVLYAYVRSVLHRAEQKGLKRLYFLARDGYVMLEIAKEIAKVHRIPLELRYLYCSRASLRMPSYHRISQTEMMDLLLHRGTNLTVLHILERAALSPAQLAQVLEETGISDPASPLSENDFEAVCTQLRGSDAFREAVLENSRAAYADTMASFRQEGLTDGTPFGIVDTGWTGSMQRSLRQLSEEIPPVTGFYFGMFARPKSTEDGVYDTWYFSADSTISVRTKFNNNLFECLCAAPHGMTTGYRRDAEGHMVPVRRPAEQGTPMMQTVEAQISLCRAFAQRCAALEDAKQFDAERMHRISRRLLQAFMYRPSAEEAEGFAVFRFCDDVTEAYAASLVQHDCRRILHQHMPHIRILRKLRGMKPDSELFWSYGTLAVSGLPFQFLYRPALRSWDVIRCILDLCKRN